MELWRELRDVGGRLERAVPPASLDGALDRLRMLEADRDSRALVAVVDAEVAGFAVLTRGPYAALFDQTAVHVHYLHVRQDMRRHGVGKALLAASASFADECGADHVMTSVLPQLRDTNRFYARLGFAPVVVRRSVPVSVLRRRLAAEGRPAASAAEHVVARRRTMRRVRAAVARMSD
jgi:GNAT superfamily N-acetyltransferase